MLEEFNAAISGAQIFDADILQLTTQEIEEEYPGGHDLYLTAKKLLTSLKPDGYYAGYDQAAYISGGVLDDETAYYSEGTSRALGAVILFKDGIVERIVFGLPTAD